MEVKFNNVYYVYNEKTPLSKMVLGNINTIFKEEKITGIIGKSGSGKTTLIQLINALIIPTKGNVVVGKRIISKDNKEKLGMVEEEKFLKENYKYILDNKKKN